MLCPHRFARCLLLQARVVSWQLKVLKDAGLVTHRPADNRRLHQLDPAGVGALGACFDSL